MIQMLRLPELLIPIMASRRDVEIALDFISIQTAVDPTGVRALPALYSGRLDIFPLHASNLPQHMTNVRVFFLLLDEVSAI